MTTLPPNYLRLSSKWLETNPLPEDGLLLEADDTWKSSSQRGRITATPGFAYATARTDLPREAYVDDEPGAEVASERAEDTNAELAMLREYVGSSYLLSDFQNVSQIRAALAAQTERAEAEQEVSKTLSRYLGKCAEILRLDESRFDPPDIIEHVKALVQFHDSIKPTLLPDLVPISYMELLTQRDKATERADKLQAEVEHRAKQRDEFQNLFIEASDEFNRRGEQLARLTAELDAVRKENDWRKTTLKNREETLNKVSNDVVIARTERDAAQARCVELERGVTRIASMEPHQHSTTCMEMHRIATALLAPSQQPDNFDSSGGESRTAIAGADGSKHTKGDCNPQGSESRKANPKIASESSASPAVNPSRPEPVKSGEWLPMETAPKRKVLLRIQTSPDAFRTVEALWINGQWDFDGMLFFKPVGWKPIAPEGKATEGEG